MYTYLKICCTLITYNTFYQLYFISFANHTSIYRLYLYHFINWLNYTSISTYQLYFNKVKGKKKSQYATIFYMLPFFKDYLFFLFEKERESKQVVGRSKRRENLEAVSPLSMEPNPSLNPRSLRS